MRAVIILALFVLSSMASAETLDVKKTLDRVRDCAQPDALAELGAIEKAETIGKRPASEIVHLTGKKARGYVAFVQDKLCDVVPVAGKPMAFAKGNFGGGATVAYGLHASHCGAVCTNVVSLKTADDKLLDVLVLPLNCLDRMTMTKRAVFAGRDSIEVGCFSSHGADQGRDDMLIDAGTGALVMALSFAAGVAWFQLEEKGPPRCTARVPGGFKIVSTGAKPEIDVTMPAEDADEAKAAGVEFLSSGCDATVTTRRFVLDASGTTFVPKAGKPRFHILRKICTCKKT